MIAMIRENAAILRNLTINETRTENFKIRKSSRQVGLRNKMFLKF